MPPLTLATMPREIYGYCTVLWMKQLCYMTMYCARVNKNRALPTGILTDAAAKRNIGCDAAK